MNKKQKKQEEKKDFFIGWDKGIPRVSRKNLIIFISVVYISIPLLVFMLVKNQSIFNDHKFEFQNIQTVQGIYYAEPIPMLRINSIDSSKYTNPYLIFVGYGKKGALSIMEKIQKKHGSLVGQEIQIAGTLLYGDGHGLLELTQKEKSFIKKITHSEKHATLENKSISIPPKGIDENAQVQTANKIKGEIIDPKCYFGVMKPGGGKVHKSCAIRCISGGIPPIFKVSLDSPNPSANEMARHQYYILRKKGNPQFYKEILQYVGEEVVITGNVTELPQDLLRNHNAPSLRWKTLFMEDIQLQEIHKKPFIQERIQQ